MPSSFNPSLSQVWDDCRRFFVREQALILPIAFATFGFATIAIALLLPARPAGEPPTPGAWMLALLPISLLGVVGYLAISRLALRGEHSVSEALRDAMRLLPRAIGIALIVALMVVLLSLVIGLIGGVLGMVLGLGERQLQQFGVVMMLPALLVISIRLFLIWPVLADREGGVMASVRTALSLSRGRAVQVAGLIALNLLLYMVLAMVIEVAGGSLLLLLGRAAGLPGLGAVLLTVLMAAYNAVYLAGWTVFVARYYAAASPTINGT